MLTQTKLHEKKHDREMDARAKARGIARHGPKKVQASQPWKATPVLVPVLAPVHPVEIKPIPKKSLFKRVLGFFQRRHGQ